MPHVNPIFNDWWMQRFDEVTELERLLHDPQVIVPPSMKNVLRYISLQIPEGEMVRVFTKFHGRLSASGCEVVEEVSELMDRMTL